MLISVFSPKAWDVEKMIMAATVRQKTKRLNFSSILFFRHRSYGLMRPPETLSLT
jgi:hypothetical protein